MDLEAEILDLKRRVGDLEGALSVLSGQLRQIHPDLTTFRTEAQGSFQRFTTVLTRVETRLDDFLNRMGRVELQVWSLRDDLPALVEQAVARVPNERRRGPEGH